MAEATKTHSIWCDDWDSLGEQPWQGGVRTRRLPRGQLIGATLHELPPGAEGMYHFHHGNEEMLIVLKGRPTLRSPEGERELEEGEVVVFPRGAGGAHRCRNNTDELVRHITVSNLASPDAVEYPDTRQISIMAFTQSQTGGPLWDMRKLETPES